MRGLRGHPCTRRSLVKSIATLVFEALALATINTLRGAPTEPIKLILKEGLLLLIFISLILFSAYTIGYLTGISRLLLFFKIFNIKFSIFHYIILFLISIISILHYSIRGEPLLACRRIRVSPLLASIATGGLLAWLFSASYEESVIIYAAAAVSGLHAACSSSDTLLSLVYGFASPLPGLGGMIVAYVECSPVPVECGEGPALGRIVGLAGQAPLSRSLGRRLGFECSDGEWRAPSSAGSRVLVVGPREATPGDVFLRIILVEEEAGLEALERSLSEADSLLARGRPASIRVGIAGERGLAEGIVGAVASYASSKGVPVLVTACSPAAEDLLVSLARSISGVPMLYVRICSLPGPSLTRLFTGPQAVRAACGYTDPEIVEWAASSVLGVRGDEGVISEVRLYLENGLCVASNVCNRPGITMLGGVKE